MPFANTLTFDNAKVGMRVMLVSDQGGDYDIGESNPLIDTEYECEGVIEEIEPGVEICVEWDNGSHNIYLSGDLVSLNDMDRPDGKCVSIW